MIRLHIVNWIARNEFGDEFAIRWDILYENSVPWVIPVRSFFYAGDKDTPGCFVKKR